MSSEYEVLKKKFDDKLKAVQENCPHTKRRWESSRRYNPSPYHSWFDDEVCENCGLRMGWRYHQNEP
ncbi:MAG: hypothetical protein ACTSPB_24715 [Candidatus Thorarchaeota archaeon]